MPIINGAINTGGITSTTGGTEPTYAPDGLNVTNGIHVANMAVTDMKVRPGVTAKNNPASVNSAGVWSDGKRELTVTIPKVLASGVQKFPSIRIICKDHPECTQAEVDALWHMAAQVCSNSAYQSFRRTGSLT